jgi:hypothetical protein
MAWRALASSPLLQRMAGRTLIPVLEVIISIVFLLIILKLLRRPRRE